MENTFTVIDNILDYGIMIGGIVALVAGFVIGFISINRKYKISQTDES